MELTYRGKELVMEQLFDKYQAPVGFRSTYKAVPIASYEMVKQYIDFTKYYVIFRGPRRRCAYSTLKRDAKAFDVYKRSDRDTQRLRVEREAFWRGVDWAKENV